MSKAGDGLERKNFPWSSPVLGLPVLLELLETSWGKWAKGK